MFIHTIDYEFGKAKVISPFKEKHDILKDFYAKASQCFGIRKSIGDTNIISSEPINGMNGLLAHNGDVIVFDKDNEKIIGEFD